MKLGSSREIREKTRFALLALALTLLPGGVPALAYDYGDPSPAEQAHLEALNRARSNPQGEAARLGIDLFEGVAEGEIDGDPVQPLTFNAQLYQAASEHSDAMALHETLSHNSPDNASETPFDRMLAAGYDYWTAGENLGLRASTGPLDEVATVLLMHDDLFIDEDYPGRGHRVNILNGDFKEVGISAASGSYEEYGYAYYLACDFGALTPSDPFVLGVVYDDLNGDGIYTAGEGIGNARIVVTETGDETHTASAGGYGLPLPAGDYTLEVLLPDNSTDTRRVSLGDESLKVDFFSVSRLLWHGASGGAGLWSLDADAGYVGAAGHGPFPGWEPVGYRRNPYGTARLLWKHAEGRVAVWKLDEHDRHTGGAIHDPPADTELMGYERNGDGSARLLWKTEHGKAILWTLDADDGYVDAKSYGPYTGWEPFQYFRNENGEARLLWKTEHGRVAIWTLDADDNRVDGRGYGPYAGWRPFQYLRKEDGSARLLWKTEEGKAAIWMLDAEDGYVDAESYGPYNGWQPVDFH